MNGFSTRTHVQIIQWLSYCTSMHLHLVNCEIFDYNIGICYNIIYLFKSMANSLCIDVPRPLLNDLWVFLFPNSDAVCVK